MSIWIIIGLVIAITGIVGILVVDLEKEPRWMLVSVVGVLIVAADVFGVI